MKDYNDRRNFFFIYLYKNNGKKFKMIDFNKSIKFQEPRVFFI